MEWVQHKDATMIFAMTEDRQIILNKEYRYGPDDFLYTFQAGIIEWESVAENAMKELEEETGYSSDEAPVFMWDTYRDGYIHGQMKFFFVKNCYQKWEQDTHEGEEIEVKLVNLETFQTMLTDGEIVDPFTLVNYFLVKEKTNNFTQMDF